MRDLIKACQSVTRLPTELISSCAAGLMDASDPALTGQYFQGEDEDEGWMSWAWSFVPAIVSTEEEEGEGEGFYTDTPESGAARPLQNPPRDPVVSVGFYCTKASLTFKVSGEHAETSHK